MQSQKQSSRSLNLITVTLAVLSALSSVTASDLIRSHHQYSSDLAKRLAGDSQLQYDTGALPIVRPFLGARQVGGGSSDDDNNSSSSSSTVPRTTTRATATASRSPTVTSSSSDEPTSTDSANSDDNSSSSATSTSTSATASYTSKSLPVPFDTSIGNNFTTTACPTFFQSFLANDTFRVCSPMSLLLQNSRSFFQAVRDPSILEKTVETSCSADMTMCSALMSSIASNLVSDANCGDDFRRQNPIVTQAYAGLLAYEPMYKASCLKDTDTDTYCIWDAFTNANNNTSAVSDSYPYYTAIGIQLPPTSSPSCSTCLKETMEIFAGYARMKGQPLAGTYLDAAKHLNTECGNSFADATVQVAVQANVNGASSIVGNTYVIAAIATIVSTLVSI